MKKVEVIVDVDVPFRFDGTRALNTLLMVVPNARDVVSNARCWTSAGCKCL